MPRVRPPKEKADVVKSKCLRCGNAVQESFYQTKDKNRQYFGKIPYCKNCIKEMLNKYVERYGSHNIAFYYLCRKIDIPYIHSNYTGAYVSMQKGDESFYNDEAFIASYMKGMAFAEQNGWGTCFDDSQGEINIEGFASFDEVTRVRKEKKSSSKNPLNDNYEVIEYDTDYLQNKWGNFSNDDLAFLESEYLDWEDKLGEIEEKSIDVIVKQICLQSLDIHNARQNGDDVNKMVKTLRELLADGGLVDKQNRSNLNTSTAGQRIGDIEKMRPVYDVDPELTDVDNIKNIVIGFTGSTCRALGKNNYYTKKFEEIYKNYELDVVENANDDMYLGESNGEGEDNSQAPEEEKC